jgi:CxxC-x17-CxxC domain-containing protein
MGEFNRGRGNFGGGNRDGGFRGNRTGGSGGFMGERTMSKAVCSECGQECEVPFKPTEGKPVYCRECFKSKKRF